MEKSEGSVAFCLCLPGMEEGSVKLINSVLATERIAGQLGQNRAAHK